jgi:hypothetical protein
MTSLGKLLIIIGAVIIVIGILLMVFHKIPFLGRLPGDIFIKKENYTFYFPITSSILVSVIVSLLFWIFRSK